MKGKVRCELSPFSSLFIDKERTEMSKIVTTYILLYPNCLFRQYCYRFFVFETNVSFSSTQSFLRPVFIFRFFLSSFCIHRSDVQFGMLPRKRTNIVWISGKIGAALFFKNASSVIILYLSTLPFGLLLQSIVLTFWITFVQPPINQNNYKLNALYQFD